jgi:hypothetical protein
MARAQMMLSFGAAPRYFVYGWQAPRRRCFARKAKAAKFGSASYI